MRKALCLAYFVYMAALNNQLPPAIEPERMPEYRLQESAEPTR